MLNEKINIDRRIENLNFKINLILVQLDTERAQLELCKLAESTQVCVKETQATIEKLKKDLKEARSQLSVAKTQQKNLNQQIKQLNNDIKKLNGLIDKAKREGNRLDKEWEKNNCPSVGQAGIQSSPQSSNNQIQGNSIGADSTPTTTAGEIECNGQCVDLSNPNSCGTSCSDIKQCHAPTDGTVSCQDGQCIQSCPLGLEIVDDECLPICPTGASRDPATGQCTCSDPNQEIVNGQCVDKCFPPGARDSNGQCQPGCPEGQFLDSSATSCVSSCGTNEVPRPDLIGGIQYNRCFPCPAGEIACGPLPGYSVLPTCENTDFSLFHCGVCGNTCRDIPNRGFRSCDSGVCNVGCVEGMTECPIAGDPFGRTACTYLFDNANCGACNRECAPGATCTATEGGAKCCIGSTCI
jgi:outer membrane murein-binding lipoprotein Lpp